jgi:hypothetical protein
MPGPILKGYKGPFHLTSTASLPMDEVSKILTPLKKKRSKCRHKTSIRNLPSPQELLWSHPSEKIINRGLVDIKWNSPKLLDVLIKGPSTSRSFVLFYRCVCILINQGFVINIKLAISENNYPAQSQMVPCLAQCISTNAREDE